MADNQLNLIIENNLLGAYINNPDLFAKCSHLVSQNIFSQRHTKWAYKAIKHLHEQGIKPDVTLLFVKAKEGGLPQADCAKIASFIDPPYEYVSQPEQYVTILFKESVAKFLYPILQSSAKKLHDYSDDAIDVLSEVKEAITKVELVLNNVSKEKDVKTVFDEAVKRIEDLKSGEVKQNGFSFGLKELDARTGGINTGINVIGAVPGSGKCLGYGTKIVMYDGTLKEVQDITVGDLLMGVDSKPRMVMSLARGREEMYLIKQNQGIDYRVNESHILSLKASHNTNRYKNGDVVNISVRDHKKLSKAYKNEFKGYKTEVDFPEKKLPLDPYFLGVWLGDGTAAKPEITTPDKEIIDYLYNFAKSIGLGINEIEQRNSKGILSKAKVYAISTKTRKGTKDKYTLLGHLRSLNLLKNKHIPQEYISNSRKNRLDLLAGLIDTDGHNSKDRYYEIIQKDNNLSLQIKFLADSLGFKTSIKKKIGRIKSSGFVGEYNRINISGNVNEIPVKVERKKIKNLTPNKNWKVTGIKIIPEGVGDYYGFTLDQDGLFLLEDFTVTHNTSLLINIIIQNAIHDNKPIMFFSLEMPAIEIMTNMIANFAQINSRALRQGDVDAGQEMTIKTMRDRLKNNFVIDDTGGISWQYVEAKTRAFRKSRKIPMNEPILCMIDYLQLMTNSADEWKGTNDEQRISITCNQLTRISKNDNLATILLSQLSRPEKDRKTPRPRMSDLKGSGAIEACAILILLMFRPDYHGITEDEQGRDLRGLCEINPVKGRYIKPEPVYARFIGKYSQFLDCTLEDKSEPF